MSVESQILPVGASLQSGRYTITTHISNGGFGITYLATEKTPTQQRVVCIKEFFMSDFCGRNNIVVTTTEGGKEQFEHYRDKFVKEGRRLLDINHPNIVNVFDVFEENGTAYYVMEYISGGSLADLVQKAGRLEEKTALQYMRDILIAVNHLHNKGILHLDIKPANILIRNSDKQIILIDFGTAKNYDFANNRLLSTTSSLLPYTPGYAPIEQRSGKVSAATDIYALGATLYKMLTGITPVDTLERHSRNITALPLKDISVSRLTRHALKKAMMNNADDRPKNVRSFAKMLGISLPENDSTVLIASHNGEDTPTPDYIKIILCGIGIVILACGAILSKKYIGNLFHKEEIIPENFVLVEGGVLRHFCDDHTQNGWKPIYKDIALDSFYISKYEVIQQDYAKLMPDNPSSVHGDSLPVTGITFAEAAMYCNMLSKQQGYDGFYEIRNDSIAFKKHGNGYRLPTKYEWAYAARDRKEKAYKYSAGDDLEAIAWYGANSNMKAHKVGLKRPNNLGLYDMAGNASEIIWDDKETIIKGWYMGGAYDLADIYPDCYKEFNLIGGGLGRNTSVGCRLVFIPKSIQKNNNIHTTKKRKLFNQYTYTWREGVRNAELPYNAGRLYQYGYGVKKDIEEAKRWYRIALENGYTNAKSKLSGL